MKTTIKELVIANSESLRQMNSHGELFKWAKANELDSRQGFSAFKKALKIIGINYDELREQSKEAKINHLNKECKHELTLFSDYKSGTNKFAITDKNGTPLWYGVLFDSSGEQSDGELEAAKKAIWLTSKIKDTLQLTTIRLNLYVDASWLLYQDKTSQKAYVLGKMAEKANVLLDTKWIPGTNNLADKWTVAAGYKNWKDNNLEELITEL